MMTQMLDSRPRCKHSRRPVLWPTFANNTKNSAGRARASLGPHIHQVDQPLNAGHPLPAGPLIRVQPGAAGQLRGRAGGRGRRHVDGVEAAQQAVVAPQVSKHLRGQSRVQGRQSLPWQLHRRGSAKEVYQAAFSEAYSCTRNRVVATLHLENIFKA